MTGKGTGSESYRKTVRCFLYLQKRGKLPEKNKIKSFRKLLDKKAPISYNILVACQRAAYSSIAQSVEHAAVNRAVVGSSPTRGAHIFICVNRIYERPHGQAVKTSPFHGGNTSSNLVGVIYQRNLISN